jgi:hypothetical protein
MPLHRLARTFARCGVEIAVSTLADWLAAAGDLLEPLVDELSRQLLDSYLVRTDATGIKVLDPTKAENIGRGAMWCYVSANQEVVYKYTPTVEAAAGPWTFLEGYDGYVQADASNSFDRLFNGGPRCSDSSWWAIRTSSHRSVAGGSSRTSSSPSRSKRRRASPSWGTTAGSSWAASLAARPGSSTSAVSTTAARGRRARTSRAPPNRCCSACNWAGPWRLRVIYWRDHADRSRVLLEQMALDLTEDVSSRGEEPGEALKYISWQAHEKNSKPAYFEVLSPYRSEFFWVE